MTATRAGFSTIALDKAGPDAAQDGRGRVALRRELDISSFGVNSYYQANAGGRIIGEHDELGPGAGQHEELYVVTAGSCTFTVDGEDVDAPQGTVVFVKDPGLVRSAVATSDDTTVLVVGGRPGEAYTRSPGEAMGAFFEQYQAKEYSAALAECEVALEAYPGNALVLYNIACLQSLLGRSDEALGALDASVTAWPKYKELAAADDDFAALREDARFQALVA